MFSADATSITSSPLRVTFDKESFRQIIIKLANNISIHLFNSVVQIAMDLTGRSSVNLNRLADL